MLAPALPDDQVAALPPPRPEWQRRLAGAVFLAVTVAVLVGGRELLRDEVAGRPWYVEDLGELVVNTLPGLLLLPVYRRVSFRRRDVLFFALLPVWGYVVATKVGYRWASLPYREWTPRPDEASRTRRLPGTPSYVVLAQDEVGGVEPEPAGR